MFAIYLLANFNDFHFKKYYFQHNFIQYIVFKIYLILPSIYIKSNKTISKLQNVKTLNKRHYFL